ncbi:COG4705 family protein [Paraburkholderia caffeinilytica]|uniref:COG4705 family protein n=1 Tax=Paraburkholderia caffeinilytica TaxID=1761016 RepID=UPI003DA0B4F2
MSSIQDSDQRRETDPASKVPQITLMFWVVKILATTVGETGGDALSMTLKLGYAISSIILLAFFFVTLTAQIGSKRYHPFVYWLVVVATTTVGTTTSDYLDRTVGLGYVKSSFMLFCGVLLILYIWRRVAGKVEFENISTRKEEVFYWLTILVSNTLGTALGDFVATSADLGFDGGALVFAGLIVIVAAAYFWLKKVPPGALFWAAYILTRPLGATLGDTLTKPYSEGGLELGRITSSLVIAVFMIVGIVLMSRSQQRRAVRSGQALLD